MKDYGFIRVAAAVPVVKLADVKANTEEKVLKELIINTYTTILTRGIKGCYVYACNENMRRYLKQFIAGANDVTLEET